MNQIIRYMLKKLPLVLLFTVFLAGVACSNSDITASSESIVTNAPGELNPVSDEMPSSVDAVIKWKTRVEQNGCEATLIVEVTQLDHWHIYSQNLPDGAMNIPTTFDWGKTAGIKYVGKTQEPASQVIDNDGFPERPLNGDKVVFKQKIKIEDGKAHDIKMSVEFMACKEACFPPTYKDFTFSVKACSADTEDSQTSDDNKEESEDGADDEGEGDEAEGDSLGLDSLEGDELSFDGPIEFRMLSYRKKDNAYEVVVEAKPYEGWGIIFDESNSKSLQLNWEGEGEYEFSGDAEFPEAKELAGLMVYDSTVQIKRMVEILDTANLPTILGKINFYAVKGDSVVKNIEEVVMTTNLNNAIDSRSGDEEKSYWQLFLFAFGGGLLALLTPCVFPMIPMTVTFFTKQSKTKSEGIRKALIYGVSIILIYVVLGVAVAKIAGAEALNAMSTAAVPNIIFFVLFVVFALSFFGAFEIRMPTKWIDKADKGADRGGLVGIFFMAFTLALVSFSCTGPVVGTVLVNSASGGLMGPIIAMFGFSLALALPFTLFAAFPGWLNSMPQSGGWLNTVKVVLAFFELAFALKFLSTADMAYQWHLLEREVYVGLWMGIFFSMGAYLMGWIRFSHDSPLEYLSVGRGILAMLTFGFVFYLTPGLWNGGQMSLVNAYLPPPNYAENSVESAHDVADDKEKHSEEGENAIPYPASAEEHGHGITVIRNYNEALAYAKAVNKPLLLDFTGWACVNCRKMEVNVWTGKGVIDYMRDSVVIASLYVDEKADLPKDEQYTNADGKKITTVGGRNMDMSISRYQQATQPLYVMIDHNENDITGKATYRSHGNIEDFQEWLQGGMDNFNKIKNVKVVRPKVEMVVE